MWNKPTGYHLQPARRIVQNFRGDKNFKIRYGRNAGSAWQVLGKMGSIICICYKVSSSFSAGAIRPLQDQDIAIVQKIRQEGNERVGNSWRA